MASERRGCHRGGETINWGSFEFPVLAWYFIYQSFITSPRLWFTEGKMQEADRKMSGKIGSSPFVCSREEQSCIKPMCVVITLSKASSFLWLCSCNISLYLALSLLRKDGTTSLILCLSLRDYEGKFHFEGTQSKHVTCASSLHIIVSWTSKKNYKSINKENNNAKQTWIFYDLVWLIYSYAFHKSALQFLHFLWRQFVLAARDFLMLKTKIVEVKKKHTKLLHAVFFQVFRGCVNNAGWIIILQNVI